MPSEELLSKLAGQQNQDGLSKRLEPEIIIPPNSLSFLELMQLVKEQKLSAFRTVTLDLTTAQTSPVQLAGAGGAIYVNTATDDTTNINLIFSNPNDDAINFTKDSGLDIPFSGLYATWSAQAGKSITIMIIPVSQLVNYRSNKKVSSISLIDAVSGLTALPDGATEVFAKGSCNGATSATIYTNATGKTIKIIESSLMCFNNTAAVASILMQIHDGAAFTKQLNIIGALNSTANGHSILHLPQIDLPNGHTVRIGGYDAAMAPSATLAYAQGMFRGYYV